MEKLPFDENALLEKYKPDFAFAYGSGVSKQKGYADGEKPMVDLVFGVNDSRGWHEKNMWRHPEDYSAAMQWLGCRRVAQLQQLGPGVLYNTYVDFQGSSLKYGVTGKEDLRKDLLDWETLYLAGRLHKPVRLLKTDDEMDELIEINRMHAANAALLMLPGRFMEYEFHETVAGLSYMGDSRNGVAESPMKARNIVSGNSEGFREIYHQILASRKQVQLLPEIGQIAQDMDPDVRADQFGRLPSGLLKRIEGPVDFEDPEAISHSIRQGIARVVAGPTRVQTLKGIASSGLSKSLRYGTSKLIKAWKR